MHAPALRQAKDPGVLVRETAQVAATGLPELDVARVRRWCDQRVPERVRDQVRIECEEAARHVTVVECRAPWRADIGPEWTRLPVARLRYTMSNGTWALYYRDRNRAMGLALVGVSPERSRHGGPRHRLSGPRGARCPAGGLPGR
ncbi:DUF3024 domain-containing protein [Micromonospora sp. IBHARD004]|uniref:DUF3024 domain-containing protein n=1 Tax=Micromonospora sp. IBHARD004 TaxID=3457764 RepID=UPI0040591573